MTQNVTASADPRAKVRRQLKRAATITSSRSPEELAAESRLIQAAQKGDREAFETLVTSYEKKVFWIAFNLVNHVEDARDIAQDAFLRVYRALDRFDPKFNFYTWLYRIVVNLAIDHLRKRGKHEALSLDEFPVEPAMYDGPDRPLANAELKSQIESVLDSLPPKYKTVIVLRDIHEMSCEEIARIINCTNATTRWRLHKAREMFKERWERFVGKL